MDYRIRWQQRRRQRRQKQLLIIPALVLAVAGIFLLARLLTRGGAVYWVHEEPEGLIPHFTVSPSAVYVAWSDGHVFARRPDTGESLTRGPLFSAPEAFNATPLLADGSLYCASDLGRLHALDARTGQPLWEFDAQAPIRYAPQMSDGKLYFASDAGKVYCLDETGKKLWVTQLEAAPSGQGALVGDTLIIATIRGNVYALNLRDGSLQWRQILGVPLFSPVTAADPLVTVGSDTGYEYVLQAADGKLVNQYYTAGLVRNAAAVSERAIYFGSTDGWLRVITRDGKTPLWAYYLGGPVSVGPVLAGDKVYVGRAGRLVALQASTGRVCRGWNDEQFAGDLVVTNEAVYVGTTARRLLVLAVP